MRSPMTFKDHHREGRIFAVRLIWSMVIVVGLSLILVARMIWLQGLQHDRYTTLSNKNRVQTQAIAPPRGLIFDRNGVLLADNQPDFSLALIPEQVPDLGDTLAELATIVSLESSDIDRFRRRLQSPRRPWEPVPLRARLTETEIARIAVTQHAMPGVRIDADPIRHYPHGELLSHVLGYVNRISAEDIEQMDADEQANYSGTHYAGRIGVERHYERLLHGQAGYRKVETNARGRILRVLEEIPPQPGQDLRLQLDIRVQQAAWDALGERRGAVVAIDPRDGGVLAFVSRPGFDPNLFVTGISHLDYAGYRDDHDQPLFNRALQGQYPPGSTVKPLIGLAGLQAGVTDWQRTIWDPGFYRIEGEQRVFRDWRRQGHGWVDMHKAVMQSCDTYFYDMGFRLGIDRMADFLARFSIGLRTGIDLPSEARGIMPSREWKRGARGQAWFHGDTINTSIGQGYMLTTPLQLALSTAVLARQGIPVVPRVAQLVPPAPTTEPAVMSTPSHWQRMTQAMVDVVHGSAGTARLLSHGAQYRMAGKSGTAQVFSLANDEEYNAEEIAERLRDHALFIAFAPADNPAIAVAVLVDSGGGGGSAAGPVARATMDAWLLDASGQLAVPPAGLPETVPATLGGPVTAAMTVPAPETPDAP
ncbi:penicillin-binding protein 2 [Isoalcanivorax pacificus]|nr:penicillin-binding protein 2 [Isoalcanivorax pacificus]